MIRDEFKVHMLNDDGKERAGAIADAFSCFLNRLEVECSGLNEKGEATSPNPRLMAIVRTKLEEACFFAEKAMASHRGHQS